MFRPKQNNTISDTTETASENNVASETTNSGNLIILDASDSSAQLEKFLDLINNPCKYKGMVVYLTAIGPTERPDPFLWKDKFYFNEGCEWYESPFALGRILDDLE